MVGFRLYSMLIFIVGLAFVISKHEFRVVSNSMEASMAGKI